MEKPRILYYKMLKFRPENISFLADNFEVMELENPSEDTPEILARMDVVFAPLGYFFDKEKIDAAKNLKVIASNTTGIPHIDAEYAKSKNIEVISLFGRREFLDTITPVSELTWGLIVALMRHIPQAFDSVKRGEWERKNFGGKRMLSRMAMGIVGLGRLGAMIAKQARAFGMKVFYFDPYVADGNPDFTKCESLKDLVALSDIVSVNAPSNKETNGMFSREIFDSFRDGSYLINTARGELIDWTALLDALKSGKLAGAALDVFEGEYHPDFLKTFGSHPALEYARTHDNLLVVPHIGGSTEDAWFLTERHTLDLTLNYLNGK
jgi:D-3-phosphoglycerate dehydrogenase